MDTVNLQTLDVEPSDRLGLAFPSGDFDTYEALADAGFGRVRLAVSWDRIQPTPWEWRFDGLDAQITILTSLGIEPLLTFYSDADWATRTGDNRALNDIPWSMTLWDAFVGTTVARYADMVDVYQVANEFAGINNVSGGWGGTPGELVAYVDTAYHAVKAADPGSTFVMGGVASFASDIALVNLGYATFEPSQLLSATTETRYTVEEARSSMMDALVEARLLYPLENAHYDKADVHLYGDRSLDGLRVELMEDITGRTVISSESGAPSDVGTGEPSPSDFFTSSVMGNLSALAAGVEAVYWFQDYETGASYYNRYVALRDADGDPKPSFWAKKLLANYLTEDAVVTAPAEGVYRIHSASDGDAAVGFAADLQAAAPDFDFAVRDVWVLEDPATGLLQRWDTSAPIAPDDFVIADTGWLADAAAFTPEMPEGVPVGSSALAFLRAVTQRTKIDMLRDGEVVDQFWYTGNLTLQEASLDKLGLSITSSGAIDNDLGLGHGVLGVASFFESLEDAARIDADEAIVVEISPTARQDDRPVLWIEADGIEAGETVRFDAYMDGTRVAAEERALTPGEIYFDPGLDFDRVDIGAGIDSNFALQMLEIEWFVASHG